MTFVSKSTLELARMGRSKDTSNAMNASIALQFDMPCKEVGTSFLEIIVFTHFTLHITLLPEMIQVEKGKAGH